MDRVELRILYLDGGVSKLRAIVNKWKFQDAMMGEQFITFTITSEKPIDWAVGDYCVFRGETFTLNYVPSVTQKARTGERQDSYTYENVKFDSCQEELTRCIMLDITPTTGDYVAALGTNYTGSSKFQLFCGEVSANGNTLTAVCALAAKIQANLDRMYGGVNGWQVLVDTTSTTTNATGDTVLVTHTDDKVLSFDNTSVAQALAEVHNKFDLDYCVKGRTIKIGYNLSNLTGDTSEETFSFGYGKGYPTHEDMNHGLFQIKRTANSQQKIVTRLRAFGSTKNMPYRYYNKAYGLSQSLFPTNLQLPDTFEDISTKNLHNASRDGLYGVDPVTGIPNLRHVKGDTNDSYIDKNDDAAGCAEGIREESARWDGSDGDLPEIYPTIEEATYSELRGALVADQDGETGNSSFPGYSGSERIDKLLAVGYKDGSTLVDDANKGDGILPESGISSSGIPRSANIGMTNLNFSPTNNGSFTSIGTNKYAGPSRTLFTIQGVMPGKYGMSPTPGAVIYGFSLSCYRDGCSCEVGYIISVKQKNSQTGVVTTLATYNSDFLPLSRALGIKEMELSEIPDVVNGENAKVSEIRVTALSDITVTFTPVIRNVVVPEGFTDSFSIGYQVANSRLDNTVTFDPEYTWFPVDDSDTLTDRFHVFVQDMGFDFEACWSDDTPVLAMKSGRCVGREFEILEDVEKVTHGGKKGYMLTLKRAEDSGLGTYYPSQTDPIAAGDTFVLLGIQMPDAYVKMAEVRLLRAATLHLADNCETKFTYQPYIDDIYLQRNLDNMVAAGTPQKSIFWRLYAGLKFTFLARFASGDEELSDELLTSDITIEKVTISMGDGLTPKVELTLNDDVQQSTIQKLTTSVDRIYNGSIFNGGSGTGGATGAMNAALLSLLQSEGEKLFLSKTKDDTAAGKITFNNVVTHNETLKAKKGVSVGNFQSRIVGSGAHIDEEGNAEFESIYSRNFISTPEFRFNRISVTEGENWNTNGFGTIKEVEVIDATTGYITLKLEENDYASVEVGDICRGIYNDVSNKYVTANLDDDSELYASVGEGSGYGFSSKSGFFTSYFWIRSFVVNNRGECKFEYELRNSATPHPCAFMKFAQYGSFTNQNRRSSSYSTSIGHYYEMVLDGVNTWKIKSANIVYRKGYLEGLTLVVKKKDPVTGETTLSEVQTHGYGLYVQNNIYFGSSIVQLDPQTIADLQESLKSYEVNFTSFVDVITVDDVGNVIGGLYTVSGELDEYRDYRIHTAISVQKIGSDHPLTIAADNDDAGDGTYKLYALPRGCTCVIENSTLFITGINNINDGVAGIPQNFDFDAMRNMESCSVDIIIDCEGKGSITRTVGITIKHDSQPFVSADLSNMSSGVSWNTKLGRYIGLPISTELTMWHNNEYLDIAANGGISVALKDAAQIAQLAEPTIQMISSSEAAARIAAETLTEAQLAQYIVYSVSRVQRTKGSKTYYAGLVTITSLPKDLPAVVELEVSGVAVYAGVNYERTLVHTINKRTDTNVYSVLPSVSDVNIRYDGSGNRVASAQQVTCVVTCDSSDDEHYDVDLTDGESHVIGVNAQHGIVLTYRKDTLNNDFSVTPGTETLYTGGVNVGTDTKNVRFTVYTVDDATLPTLSALLAASNHPHEEDSEDVPCVLDGLDGVEGIVADLSNQHSTLVWSTRSNGWRNLNAVKTKASVWRANTALDITSASLSINGVAATKQTATENGVTTDTFTWSNNGNSLTATFNHTTGMLVVTAVSVGTYPLTLPLELGVTAVKDNGSSTYNRVLTYTVDVQKDGYSYELASSVDEVHGSYNNGYIYSPSTVGCSVEVSDDDGTTTIQSGNHTTLNARGIGLGYIISYNDGTTDYDSGYLSSGGNISVQIADNVEKVTFVLYTVSGNTATATDEREEVFVVRDGVDGSGSNGVGYTSIEDYYAVSADKDTIPTPCPALTNGVRVFEDTISDGIVTQSANAKFLAALGNSGTWATSGKSTNESTPWLWNFEKHTMSDGSIRLSPAHRIGSFAKGIRSITEYYACSAHATDSTGDYDNAPIDVADIDDFHLDPDYLEDGYEWEASDGYDSPADVFGDKRWWYAVGDERVPDGNFVVTDRAPTQDLPYQWNWEHIEYTDGTSEDFYHVSARIGDAGAPGGNTATVYLYKRSKTLIQNTGITGTLYYKFSTKKLYTDSSCTTELTSVNDWTPNIPSGSDPIYVTAAIVFSTTDTDDIGQNEWVTPAQFTENGFNSSTVFLYKRSASAPNSSDKPTSALYYKFSNGKLYTSNALTTEASSELNGWSLTIPATNGNPCYVRQAAALSTDSFDEIAVSDWSDARKIVEDGVSQPSYIETQEAWSNAPSVNTPNTEPTPNGGWSTYTPTNNNHYSYLWRRSRLRTLNASHTGYNGENDPWTYTRLSGTNGTSIDPKGTVVYVANSSGDLPNSGVSSNDLAIVVGSAKLYKATVNNGTATWAQVTNASSDGDCYVVSGLCTYNNEQVKGHMWMWSDEANNGNGSWIDLGAFKGDDGKTYYTHLAWADKVTFKNNGDLDGVTESGGTITIDTTKLTGFTIGMGNNNDGKTWMGVLIDQNVTDSPDPRDYTWRDMKGKDGEDSADREWIYKQSPYAPDDANAPTIPSSSGTGTVNGVSTAYGETVDDWVPNGWTDHQQGVSPSMPYEYSCYRDKARGTGTRPWSVFKGRLGTGATTGANIDTPITQSHFGEHGTDGDGVEYVFVRTKKNVAPQFYADSSNRTDSRGKTSSKDKYLPRVYVAAEFSGGVLVENISGNGSIDNVTNGSYAIVECTDNAVGSTEEWPFEWVLIRRKTAAVNGYRSWDAYSGSMSHWANWSKDGDEGPEGKGSEWIFFADPAWNNWDGTDANKPTIYEVDKYRQSDNYCPYTDIDQNYQWSAEPPGVSASVKYEFEALRKKVNGVWGHFGAVRCRNRYAADGVSPYVIGLTNEQSFVNCDTNGNVLDPTNGYETSGLMLFLGQSYAFTDFDIEVTPHYITCNGHSSSFTLSSSDKETAQSNGSFSLVPSAITSNSAQIDIVCTHKTNSSLVLSASYKINKNYAGSRGNNAVTYRLIPSLNVIHKNKNSDWIDTTLDLQVNKVDGTTETQLSYSDFSGEGLSLSYDKTGSTGNSLSSLTGHRTATLCGSGTWTRIVLKKGSVVVDSERLNVIQDGEDGSDLGENLIDNSEPPYVMSLSGVSDPTSEHYFFVTDKTLDTIKMPPVGSKVSGQAKITLSECSFKGDSGTVNVYTSRYNGDTNTQTVFFSTIEVTGNGVFYVKNEGITLNNVLGTWRGTINVRLDGFVNQGTVSVELLKLEEGSHCTAWSLSENDKIPSIYSLKSDIGTLKKDKDGNFVGGSRPYITAMKKVGGKEPVNLSSVVSGDGTVADGMTITKTEIDSSGNVLSASGCTQTSTNGVLYCNTPNVDAVRLEVTLTRNNKTYATLAGGIPIIQEQAGTPGADGVYPRDRGLFKSGNSYIYQKQNGMYIRDMVKYEIDGIMYAFLVKTKDTTVTSAPSDALGDSNWEAGSVVETVIANTFFGENANIGGFMASAEKMRSTSVLYRVIYRGVYNSEHVANPYYGYTTAESADDHIAKRDMVKYNNKYYVIKTAGSWTNSNDQNVSGNYINGSAVIPTNTTCWREATAKEREAITYDSNGNELTGGTLDIPRFELNGGLGTLRVTPLEDSSWSVDDDGVQRVGIADGRRVEISPIDKRITIYDDYNRQVTQFDGERVSTLDSLYGNTSGELGGTDGYTGNHPETPPQSNWHSGYKEGYEILGQFSPISGMTTITASNGTLSAQGSSHYSSSYYDGDPAAVLIGGVSQPTLDGNNYLFKNHVIGRLVVVHTSSTGATVVDLVLAEVSANGVLATSSVNSSRSFWANSSITYKLAVYYKIGLYHDPSKNYGVVSWSAIKVVYGGGSYLSRIFANGFVYGLNSLEYMAAVAETSGGSTNMHIKALAGNGLYGFEISSSGIKFRVNGTWYTLGVSGGQATLS